MSKSPVEFAKKNVISLQSKNITIAQKVEALRGIAEGLPVVVVTCGPSLRNIPPEKLIELGSKCILIAVKQAHDYLRGHELFHLINQYNLKKYFYLKNTYVIAQFNRQASNSPIHSRVDLMLPGEDALFQLPHQERVKLRLSATLDFDKYLFTNTLERPWGPGVILELAIYLAIHIGSNNIYLVGYDLAPLEGKVKSFIKYYDSPSFTRSLLDRLSRRLARYSNFSETRIRYELGLLYNPAGSMDSDENRLLVSSSKDLYLWLKNRDISLSVCSDKSYVSELIPRTDIDSMYEKLNI